jgi:hypothetical protein
MVCGISRVRTCTSIVYFRYFAFSSLGYPLSSNLLSTTNSPVLVTSCHMRTLAFRSLSFNTVHSIIPFMPTPINNGVGLYYYCSIITISGAIALIASN